MDEAEKLFKAAGFNWESFNNGYHWRVSGIDFYPTTERWIDTKNSFCNVGIESLIRYVNKRQHALKETVRILTVEQIFEVARTSKKTNLFDICEVIHKAIYTKEPK